MITLRRSDTSKNMARFYELSLQPSLFGETLLIKRWGRNGTYGRVRSEWFDEPEAAAAALSLWRQHKEKRGYVEVLTERPIDIALWSANLSS
jgi:predicted DNA-binding WGR domain protein